jgi:cytoskeletal protein RodZ
MRALGEEFRAAREARGLSLSDVAEQIHIRSVYLQAIENEDWSAIGAPVYIRGFIRTYARFLGLDGESAVQRFNESAAGLAQPTAPPREAILGGRTERRSPSPSRRSPSPLLYAAGFLACVLVGAVLYNLYALQSAGGVKAPMSAGPAATATAALGQVTPSPLPGASARPVATPAAAATARPTKTMTIRLSETSWLRVLVDGQDVMEGLFPPGTVRTFHGNRALVRIGNAGGVAVDVNGKSVGKLGNEGDVVERSFSLTGG